MITATVDPNLIVIITSVVITGWGILTNALSLSYFIQRENKRLGSRLFMLLNALDLAVCMSGTLGVTMYQWFYQIEKQDSNLRSDYQEMVHSWENRVDDPSDYTNKKLRYENSLAYFLDSGKQYDRLNGFYQVGLN